MSSALVVCRQDDVTRALRSVLRPLEFDHVEGVASAAEGRRRLQETDYDLLVINTPLADEFGVDFSLDAMAEYNLGVILIAKSEVAGMVEDKLYDTTAFVVTKPLDRERLVRSVRYVLAARAKLRRLEEENEKLRRKLADMGTINRAKVALMLHEKLDEDAAHRQIQKTAMDRRQTPREVAEEIIAEYEV